MNRYSLFSKAIVAPFIFSYNVNEYIGLPSLDSKSFLVFILKTQELLVKGHNQYEISEILYTPKPTISRYVNI
jgi:hypothetical protein